MVVLKEGSAPQAYVLGDPALEKVIGLISAGSFIVISGHPGAGKTTFSAKLIYENVRTLGVRALYISFAETFNKFAKQMKRLGMDFESLVKSGHFEFIHLPTISGFEAAERVVNLIVRKHEEGFRIFVVDPITVLLEQISDPAKMRSLLHGVLYDLVTRSGSLLIAIADLPRGKKQVDLGGLEFVADGVFVMKTKLERGMLMRVMEVRKLRGNPIPLAEIPFTIVDGYGPKFQPFVPPEEIPASKHFEFLPTSCSLLDEAWGGVPLGGSVAIVYPAGANVPSSLLALIAKFLLTHGLETAIVSFEMAPDILLLALERAASMFGIPDSDKLRTLVIAKKSFNPTAYSTYELLGNVLALVEQSQPKVLLLHGLTTLVRIYGSKRFTEFMYNLWLYLKSMMVTTFKLAEYRFETRVGVDQIVSLCGDVAVFSDIVHVVIPKFEGTTFQMLHVIWKSLPGYVVGSRAMDKPIVVSDELLSHVCLGSYVSTRQGFSQRGTVLRGASLV